MIDKPLLCRLGLHKPYHYLPKVGGDIGDISIACRRCGWGLQYFTGKWTIQPSQVQESASRQAEIEYGRVLGLCRYLDNPKREMELALEVIRDTFTKEELKPIYDMLDKLV